MKKFFEKLSNGKGETAFVRVLLSWRLWLVGALLGGLLGVLLSFVLPKQYETFATVVIDHNREQAWVTAFDKELFYFYDVENRKLEAYALGDTVLNAVVEDVPEVSVLELREDMIQLVKQYDGIWEMHVKSNDPDLSRAIAKSWAQAFTNEVMSSLDFQMELEELRADFLMVRTNTVCDIKEQNNNMTNDQRKLLDENEEYFKKIVRDAKGLSPFVEVVATSVDDLVVVETPVNSSILFAGVITGMLMMLGLGLIFLHEEE